jgi:hypothetical protein
VPRSHPRGRLMSEMGQKCPKGLRLPAGKGTYEHMGGIVPQKVITDLRLLPADLPSGYRPQ